MGSGKPETTLVFRASLRLSSLGGNQPNFLFSLAFAGVDEPVLTKTCVCGVFEETALVSQCCEHSIILRRRGSRYLYKSIDPQGRAQQFARVCEIIYPSTSSFANRYCTECILNPLAFSVRQKHWVFSLFKAEHHRRFYETQMQKSLS